jgi:hypothetical protein
MFSQSQFNRRKPMKQITLTGGICRRLHSFKKIVPTSSGQFKSLVMIYSAESNKFTYQLF